MLSAKLTIPKKINELGDVSAIGRTACFLLIIILAGFFSPAFSQDNSPYTRYGLGDIVPSSNVNSRGMGGVSAAYFDQFSINFNNPASYGFFYSYREAKSKKLLHGRAILDLGLNIENRTLIDPALASKFPTSNALFSHVQVGVPIKSNWGLSFGLRPITRISYKLIKNERLFDPGSGSPIDSSSTLNEGDGGAYLASIGTGFRIKNLSFGINAGYMFGKKDYSARRSLINDTVEYTSGNFQTRTNFGDLYFNGGLVYQIKLDSAHYLTLGAYGNMKQNIKASTDSLRETYFFDPSTGNVRIDSVYEKTDSKGRIVYPASITAGFVFQKIPRSTKEGSWLIGMDFSYNKWNDYRFFGQSDSMQNKWEARLGGEIRPSIDAARKSYFGNVAYRFGVFMGTDYIKVKEKLPVFGASFGMGLPLRNFNRLNNQVSIINLALEYIKRGNDKNLLKENMFRISLGFSLSDLWFIKRKYE